MSRLRGGEEQSVANTLMVSFVMVVFDELVNRTAQRAFANENQSIQARFLDCPHEALRVGVEIWRTWGQADRLDTGRSQGFTKRGGEAWVAIMKEEAFPSQTSINRIGELATAVVRQNQCDTQRGTSRACRRHREQQRSDTVDILRSFVQTAPRGSPASTQNDHA